MKHVLFLSVILLLVGLFFLVYRWPQGYSKTFSQHAAAQRASAYYYLGLFLTVCPLLALFFYGYFIPHYHLSLVFALAIFLAIAAQLVAAFVPEIGGWKSQVHRTAAGWSAFGLFVAVASMIYELAMPLAVRLVSILTIVIMLACSGLATRSFIKREKFQHRYFLWLQAIYYGAFFVTVLLVTYGV